MSTTRFIGPWPAITIAAVFGTWRISRESLWADEAFSAAMARMDWSSFAAVVAERDLNMALYNLLLRFWSSLSASEAWLRLPSVGMMCLGVLILHRLVQRLVGTTAAAVSCIILVTNAFVIGQMQEARAGAAAVLAACLSTLLLLRVLDRPTASRSCVYALVVGLGAYVHLFCLLVFLSHLPMLARERKRLAPRCVLIGGATMALLLLPFALFLIARDASQVEWIPETTLDGAWEVWFDLTGGGGRVLAVASLMLLGVAAIRHRRNRTSALTRDESVFWWWFLLPIVVALAVSAVQPILVARYLVVILPAMSTLMAIGLLSLPSAWLRVSAAVLLILLSARSIWIYQRDEQKPDWRALTSVVLANAEPGDALVTLEDIGRAPIDYYVATRDMPGAIPASAPGDPPWGTWEAISVMELGTPPDLESLIAAHDRVWIATRETPSSELLSGVRDGSVEPFGEVERVHLFLMTPAD